MEWNFVFFFNSILLGAGLAMDAFSVALANGLHEPRMSSQKMCTIAGVFAFFQALMPIIGWICIHTVVQYFRAFETLIPWIALALLGYIGGKMIHDSRCEQACPDCVPKLTVGVLLTQGIATSIDALSVGFTIAAYDCAMALAAAAMIATVTFGICMAGIAIGKKAGTHLSGKAGMLGGVILILIGLEIFISSWL